MTLRHSLLSINSTEQCNTNATTIVNKNNVYLESLLFPLIPSIPFTYRPFWAKITFHSPVWSFVRHQPHPPRFQVLACRWGFCGGHGWSLHTSPAFSPSSYPLFNFWNSENNLHSLKPVTHFSYLFLENVHIWN